MEEKKYVFKREMCSQKGLTREEMRHKKPLLHKKMLSIMWQMLRKLLLQTS